MIHSRGKGLLAELPESQRKQRLHGSLEWITDSEHRPLRPIGTTAMDVAMRTGVLLSELIAIPSVRIFRGVWSACAQAPLITHVITAGRSVFLIESVAWPPGRYSAAGDGRIFCGDRYIGQSIGYLISSVRYWRGLLEPSHKVAALVVVHQMVQGRITLPAAPSPELAWTLADNVVSTIEESIQRGQPISGRALSVLIAATAHPAG